MSTTDPGQVEPLPLESALLPTGVTQQQWAEERARWQNPRIRALLGCANILEAAYESNQAILSCSPERLAEMWRDVRSVAKVLAGEVIPLLDGPSRIPKLEEARERTHSAAEVIHATVIAQIERMPEAIEESQSRDFRRLLCVSLGQLRDFVQDAFADLMANDPRSFHDSGYFLSRRFRRDVEEAEWLYMTVDAIGRELEALEIRRRGTLVPLMDRLRTGALPGEDERHGAIAFLDELTHTLAPRLKEVVSLRGIRFGELEVMDRWVTELPVRCHLVLELLDLARRGEPLRREAGDPWAGLIAGRVQRLLVELDGLFKDLETFLPLWQRGIANRRAMAFRRTESSAPLA